MIDRFRPCASPSPYYCDTAQAAAPGPGAHPRAGRDALLPAGDHRADQLYLMRHRRRGRREQLRPLLWAREKTRAHHQPLWLAGMGSRTSYVVCWSLLMFEFKCVLSVISKYKKRSMRHGGYFLFSRESQKTLSSSWMVFRPF